MKTIKKVLTYLAHRKAQKNPDERNRNQFRLAHQGLEEREY